MYSTVPKVPNTHSGGEFSVVASFSVVAPVSVVAHHTNMLTLSYGTMLQDVPGNTATKYGKNNKNYY